MNLSYEASKNLFISNLNFQELLYDKETTKRASSQEFFLQNMINMKFLEDLNKDSLIKKAYDGAPKITISSPKEKENLSKKLFEDKTDNNQKLLFSFESKLFCWNKVPYRNMIFNPTISNKILFKHLLEIYEDLFYSKYCIKKPDLWLIEKKFVNLNPMSKKTLKVICFYH